MPGKLSLKIGGVMCDTYNIVNNCQINLKKIPIH